MSNSISGGISFSGISSGMNTDSIIESLKQTQEIQKNRMELSQAEYEYRISALEEVVKKMNEAMEVLKNYNTPSKMYSLSVDSSTSSVASAVVKNADTIPKGSYEIDVQQTASTSLYCSKTIFNAKDAVINDTGQNHTFTYTYKGTTREINVADGTNLEQLVSRINNDAKNPGVRATLIKNGDGYMFQIQGTDTGADADLSLSSTLSSLDSSYTLFTGNNVSINQSGSAQDFSYVYKGKHYNFEVADNMTAQEFVTQFNEDSDQGIKARLVLNGSDYRIEFLDKSNSSVIDNLQINTSMESLGGKAFSSLGDVVNTTSEAQKISYNYLGKQYSVTLDAGDTLETLLEKINTNTNHQGLTADFVDGKIVFDYEKKTITADDDTKPMEISFEVDGKKHEISIEEGILVEDYLEDFNEYSEKNNLGLTASLDADGKIVYKDKDGNDFAITCDNSTVLTGDEAIKNIEVIDNEAACFSSNITGFGKASVVSGKNMVIAQEDSNFSFDYGGQSYSFAVSKGTTLQQFVDEFNAQGTGLTAEIQAGASGYKLVYKDASGNQVNLENVNAGSMTSIGTRGDNWYKQEARDAKFTINGWEQEFTSASNTLSEVVEGMEITIKSTGKTVLNAVNDTAKIKENILEVVDAINLVKATILELSKVDDEKDVGEYDEDTLTSQLTWQKGSALTGNYGVQLVLSDYNNIVSSMSSGFSKKQSADDIFGDLYTTLGEIGITTNTNAGEETHGLLIIDETKLEEALEKDAEAVVELFSATMKGTTTSADFTVASTGVSAKAGSYEVTYDVDANGQATNVYINGVLAQTDPEFPGRWTVGDAKNAAAGVAIQFANGGMSPGSYSSQINIRQGKVNELLDFFKQEVTSSEVEGVEQGHIPTIIASFRETIDNLQDKIDSETDRIALWETREKAKYARLEQVLTEYNQKMEQISSYMTTTTSSS